MASVKPYQHISLPSEFSWLEDDRGLSLLHHTNQTSQQPTQIRIDFLKGEHSWRLKHNGGGGLLVAKACGVSPNQPKKILDLTAGLARDASVLAAHGAHVTMVEQSQVLCALIDDALKRLMLADDVERPFQSSQLSIHCLKSEDYLSSDALGTFDVVYVDPMFTHLSKKSAPSKEMAALRALHGHSDEKSDDLFNASLTVSGSKRVVIKRPPKAGYALDRKPTYSLKSKSMRLDVYQR